MFREARRAVSSGDGSPKSVAFISGMSRSLMRSFAPLIKSLLVKAIDVSVLAPDVDREKSQVIHGGGARPVMISLDRTGMNPLHDIISLVSMSQILRRSRPGAVLGLSTKPVIYGSLAAWLAGVPRRYALVAGLGYVFTDDGAPQGLKRRALRRLVTLLYRMAFRVCDCVFFHNADDLETFVGHGLLPRAKAELTTGSGVDLDEFRPAPLPDGPVTFLLIARLLREKGIREYVEAARILRARGVQAQFLLLGDVDSNPGSLKRDEAMSWLSEGLIEWPGEVEDVRPWIARSHVYVLPSWREGVPRSTQEAMAMGRPVITTDAVGCRETVEDGVNGFLVPVRDAAALAAAMLRFIENPALIESMGRESRRLAEERFDVHKINAIILDAMGISSHLPRDEGLKD